MYVKLSKKKLFRKSKMKIILEAADIEEAIRIYIKDKQWPVDQQASIELFTDDDGEITAELSQ